MQRASATESADMYIIERNGFIPDCSECILRLVGRQLAEGVPGVSCTGFRSTSDRAYLSIAHRSPHKPEFLQSRYPCMKD